jgi:hypothetical protein
MGGSEGVGGRLASKIVVLNYTHLNAFIAFYHLFLGGNVTSVVDGQVGKFCLWRNCGSRIQGAAFCRLLPPFAAFYGGGRSAEAGAILPNVEKVGRMRAGSGKRWIADGRLTHLFPLGSS